MYKVCKTTHAHLAELSETMCAADQYELELMGWSSPYAALLQSFVISQRTRTVTYEGRVVCIFGCVRVGHYGVIWLLSIGFLKHRMRLARWIDPLLNWVTRGCTLCGNMVPKMQPDHVRWLRHLGFKIDSEHIVNNVECYHMVREVKKCAIRQ